MKLGCIHGGSESYIYIYIYIKKWELASLG